MARTKRQLLRSVREVVEAYGGTNATARRFSRAPGAISAWIATGYIPPAYHYAIHMDMWQLGNEVDPSVFGYHVYPPLQMRRKVIA
ncbi:MAG TPA: hypothetical protein VNK52_16200 [Hyphomicrobiaceae bacterium]|nr:hypothetical protein [Hyphomicrobiaceae bacterium]